MLQRLAVKDYILIDELDIDFSDGFNVLTGETGAGKSIILGALRLALGARNTGDVVRVGAEKAKIQALFDCDGEQKIFSREIFANGRSVMKIDDEIVNLNSAQTLGAELLSIHGQNDQQQLLDSSGQRQILDSFLDNKALMTLEQVAALYKQIKELKKELAENKLSPEEIAREIDMIDFQIAEIDNAELTEEDDNIENEFRRIQKLKNYSEQIYATYCLIDGDDNEYSVTRLLNNISRNLASLSEIGSDYEKAQTQTDDISYQLSEIGAMLEHSLENINSNAEEIIRIEKRLDVVSLLKKKYGKTVDEIITYRLSLDTKRENLAKSADSKAALHDNLQALEKEYQEQSEALSKSRAIAAKTLKNKLTESLKELNFNDVAIEIELEKIMGQHLSGNDKIDILIALNKGQKLTDLKTAASGGEISRIMLAIKSIIADKTAMQTLIFDEIDSGISGFTASVVADKLYALSRYHQVICISHLSQVALMADRHFKIEKDDNGKNTISNIYALNTVERAVEISRIIGGLQSDKELISQAEKLLQGAKKRKEQGLSLKVACTSSKACHSEGFSP